MVTSRPTFSSDDLVVKSPNDKRLYRFLQLENGLSALLVHDPEIYPDGCPEPSEDEDQGKEEESNASVQTKKAAAAMCVEIGSFSDPFEVQGLAHFLEHMLFMGSTGFPDENEYGSYLSKHGGQTNAFTQVERTYYYFDVKREFLKGALERFSQFFISPLFKKESMEREVLSVDSEFNLSSQNDGVRFAQFQCYTSTPGHPFNKFFAGNKKSLVDAMEKGINLREQILKLFRDYYHGGLMKLSIIGGESLDVLESWVLELFGEVKKGVQAKPRFTVKDPIWQSGKLYKLEAVEDIHILDLAWTLTCLQNNYLMKPDEYIAYVLGHEGKGSLSFLLKAKGWATSLSACVAKDRIHRSSVAYIFVLSINLTDSGKEKIYEIIGYVYQCLKLLRQVSPPEWIFRELQDIGNMEFRFAEEEPQDDYAAKLAVNLCEYPAEHVIYGNYAYKTWDEDLVNHIIGFFTPENMRVDIISKDFSKLKDFKVEPWYGSHYFVDDIAPSLMDLWRDPPEIDTSLHLPPKNEFIASDFSIRASKVCNDLPLESSPRCILDEPLMKLWYKLDNSFKVPRVCTYFCINLSGAYNSVKNNLLAELFTELLTDKLNVIIYQATIANLKTSVVLNDDKLELKVSGFNDKLPNLLSEILATVSTFMPSEDRFKVIKENLERVLRNSTMQPESHLLYLRTKVLYERFYDPDERIDVLNDLSFVDLKALIPELLSQLYIEGLCHGNFLEEEAINLSNIFKENFSVQPLPLGMRHCPRIICLPSGANLVRDVRVKNKLERNSAVELYFQIEPELGMESIRLKALIDLFGEIIADPFYDQLRTKEQLGYSLRCNPLILYRIYGFYFDVESSEYSPMFLQERIENFITGLQELLLGLDEASFKNYKDAAIGKLLKKDLSLTDEADRYWDEIVDKRYMFDFSQKEAEELKNIQKKDMIDWYKTYLHESSPKCRKLATRVWGCEANMIEAETPLKPIVAIKDVEAFKKSSTIYPSCVC